MNHEQSIDDILKLLKESISDEQVSDEQRPFENEPVLSRTVSLSNEDVHAELKKQYVPEESASEPFHDGFDREFSEISSEFEPESEASDILIEEEDELPPWETGDGEEPESEEGESAFENEYPEDDSEEEKTEWTADSKKEAEKAQEEEVLSQELRDYEIPEDFTIEATPNAEIENIIEVEFSSEAEETEREPLEAELRPSVMDLLLQMGCEEEWEEEEIATDEQRHSSESQFASHSEEKMARWESLSSRWNQRLVREIIRVIGLAVTSVLLLIYDAIPDGALKALKIEYRSYPLAYVLIGMQLVLITALWLGPRLWNGLKQLVRLRVHLYSVASLVTLFVLIYDLILVACSITAIPPRFHFFAGLSMLMAEITTYWDVRRQTAYVRVWRPDLDKKRFTLSSDIKHDPIAKTMYRGGLPYEKKVFSPSTVDSCPVIEEEDHCVREDRFFSRYMVPSVVLSFVAVAVAILVGQRLEVSLIAGITLLFCILPLPALFLPQFAVNLAVKKLQRREIFLRNENGIKEYGEVDYLVFKDLHLFSKAKTEDIGMISYEQDQIGDLLGCLDRLYQKIGGPMSDVFTELPEEYRKDTVRIRRMKRNGIEAIVDRKHVLLVGDSFFMRQYGLLFNEESTKKGRSTLCISLDGKKSAKLNVRYRIEPVFEMLVERLYTEKVQCVVETFDPMVQAKFVATARHLGQAPISIVHKSLTELNEASDRSARWSRESMPQLVACSSRLKLAEAVVWCKRLRRIQKKCGRIGLVTSILGFLFSILTLILGNMGEVTQYWVLFWILLTHGSLWLCVFRDIPGDRTFTVDALAEERQKTRDKKQKKKRG